MELMEAMKTRHSVRQYTDRPIPAEAVAALRAEIDACNRAAFTFSSLRMSRPPSAAGWRTTVSSAMCGIISR